MTTAVNNATGNLTAVVDHGHHRAGGGDNGDERYVWYRYAINTNPGVWILNLLCETKAWSGSSPGTTATLTGFQRHFYDGTTTRCATPTVGNLTRTRTFLDHTGTYQTADTFYGYDTKGRLIWTEAPEQGSNRRSRISYNPTRGTVTATTNPLGHRTTYAYDAAARLITVNGPKVGDNTVYAYDDHGRVTTVHGPGHPTTGNPDVRYRYNLGARPASTTTKVHRGPTGAEVSAAVVYVDGFGRELQTQTSAPVVNKRWVTYTDRDNQGLPYRKSAVFEHSGEPGTSMLTPAWATVGSFTRTFYDDLGRVTAGRLRSNATFHSQSRTRYQTAPGNIWTGPPRWVVATKDGEGHHRLDRFDAYGEPGPGRHRRELSTATGGGLQREHLLPLRRRGPVGVDRRRPGQLDHHRVRLRRAQGLPVRSRHGTLDV